VGWLNQIVFWHWWVLAGVLLIVELTSPVFFFLWLAFAAAAVGFVLLAFPAISPALQLALFGALSLVAMLAWRRYRAARPAQSARPKAGSPGSSQPGAEDD
jgi:inner membrane protein